MRALSLTALFLAGCSVAPPPKAPKAPAAPEVKTTCDLLQEKAHAYHKDFMKRSGDWIAQCPALTGVEPCTRERNHALIEDGLTDVQQLLDGAECVMDETTHKLAPSGV